MLSKEIFDKATFNKVNICTNQNDKMKHWWYRFKTTKNTYQPTDFKISRKKIRVPKVLRLLPNLCDSQKENHIYLLEILDGWLSMAQVGPLRECQDIMDPASACLVIIWSLSCGSFRLPVFLVWFLLCIARCLRCGGLLQCRRYGFKNL